ncbi:MAG: hypothetical protein QXK88_06445 [Desulfurococcaceae archaeon]
MVKPSLNTYMVSALTAIAVILRFYEFPYPIAPFLKYDVSGVPLTIIALISLRAAFSALPVYYVIPTLMGSDPIGMAMKCLAEMSTFIPTSLIITKLKGRVGESLLVVLATALSGLARVAAMAVANYVITPYWLMWAGWAKDMSLALSFVVYYMPHIALFNLSISIIVSPTAVVVYRVLNRAGFLK